MRMVRATARAVGEDLIRIGAALVAGKRHEKPRRTRRRIVSRDSPVARANSGISMGYAPAKASDDPDSWFTVIKYASAGVERRWDGTDGQKSFLTGTSAWIGEATARARLAGGRAIAFRGARTPRLHGWPRRSVATLIKLDLTRRCVDRCRGEHAPRTRGSALTSWSTMPATAPTARWNKCRSAARRRHRPNAGPGHHIDCCLRCSWAW